MDSYEKEVDDARRRLAELGCNPEDFTFSMSMLPPDPDGGGMYTVEYEIEIRNETTSRTLTVTGGIGWHWVDELVRAVLEGRLG